jgi:hypothetical protein
VIAPRPYQREALETIAKAEAQGTRRATMGGSGYFAGKRCNCNPDITVAWTDDSASQN